MTRQKLFIGIDLGGTYIKGGVVTQGGEVVREHKIETEADRGPKHVLDRIARFVLELGADSPVAGVGVGVPGQVETATGIVYEAPNLPGWREIPASGEISKRLSIPITLDNDANLAGLGEYAYGAGKGVSEMMMITLGTGVGGGLILGGEVYRGVKGGAGEFGHTIINMDGWKCGCGRLGCVEAYVGTQGILRTVQEKLQKGAKSVLSKIPAGRMTPKDICDAAERGDSVGIETLRDVGTALGVGLGSVANLLNLQRIVAGGGVANAGDYILEPARKSLAKTALAISAEVIDLVPAKLGEAAGIIGAARLAMLAAGKT